MSKLYFVYIMTNKHNTVLYVGITNSLARRIFEHKARSSPYDSFTKKYNIDKLVYYEAFQDVRCAIAREKQIKSGSRKAKVALVNKINSGWKDLYSEIYF
ncbi:MAG: GIY-YIG nuclease family protein [Patescibacteria group bacterium]|nr:GIY-YIG nuclease family protein [Patescibacteria group bacterium]